MEEKNNQNETVFVKLDILNSRRLQANLTFNCFKKIINLNST